MQPRIEVAVACAAAMIDVSNQVRAKNIPDLLQSAGKVIGQLATAETVMRIARTNPDAIHVFFRGGREKAENFVSKLFLPVKGEPNCLTAALICSRRCQFIGIIRAKHHE